MNDINLALGLSSGPVSLASGSIIIVFVESRMSMSPRSMLRLAGEFLVKGAVPIEGGKRSVSKVL